MMLYRSLVLGLVGALVLLEVARSGPASPPPPRETPTIIDVSRAALASPIDLGPLFGLKPGERIARLDDRPLSDGTSEVGAAIRTAFPGQYLDLDVLRPDGARRVLVLVH
jgi:hypothetical protein